MIHIKKATDKDYDELIAMANLSFTKPNDPKDFKKSLPKYYTYSHHHIDEHYIIQKDNKIVATLGAFDNDYIVNDTTLKVRGLGTMAVLPTARNNGYMKKLMEKATNDLIDDQIDLAFLSGRRQRYEYFSFTPAGVALKIVIKSHNLKHSVLSSCDIKFKIVQKNDFEILKQMNELYCQKSIRPYRFPEHFHDIVSSWYFEPIAFFKDDIFLGYLLQDKDFNISEIECIDSNLLPAILLEYFKYFKIDKAVFTPLPVFEKEKINTLCNIAQNTDLVINDNMNIINYEKVMKAFFKVKADLQPLTDGKYIIDIIDRQKLSIEIKDQNITIIQTDKPADITLTHLEAMQLIFSPYTTLFFNKNLPHFIYNWFPLPLFFPRPDNA